MLEANECLEKHVYPRRVLETPRTAGELKEKRLSAQVLPVSTRTAKPTPLSLASGRRMGEDARGLLPDLFAGCFVRTPGPGGTGVCGAEDGICPDQTECLNGDSGCPVRSA